MTTLPETALPSAAAPVNKVSGDLFGRVAAAVVLGISFLALAGVGGWLMFYVVPRFERIFRDFHTDLPAATQSLIDLCHLFQTFWYIFIPLILSGYTILLILALLGGRIWWKIILLLALVLTALSILAVGFVTIALFQPLIALTQHVKP